jgi:SNF2 family DNA or RNA helicase
VLDLEPVGVSEPVRKIQKKLTPKSPPKTGQAKKRSRTSPTANHPYCLTYRELIDVVNEALGVRLLESDDSRALNVWLPTFEETPLRSDIFYPATDSIDSDKPPLPPEYLHLWSTDAVLMDGERFAVLLSKIKGRKVLTADVHLSEEFEYLEQLRRFAASLVVRQRYLPSMKTRGSDLYACYEALLIGDDQSRLVKLATKMPSVLRAAAAGSMVELKNQKKKELPFALPAVQSAFAVMHELVDGIVRNATSVPTPISQVASVHDSWLKALRQTGGKMQYDRPQLLKFFSELKDWQIPATALSAAPFRLAFRLEEPDKFYTETESTMEQTVQPKWTIHYFLQSTADPSLLIPAAHAWQDSADLRLATTGDFRPREAFLLSLAKASQISPAVLESLSEPNPTGFQLDNLQAFQFLTESVPELEEAGFAVLLPKWWTEKGRRKLRLTGAQSRSAPTVAGANENGTLSLQSLLKFDWQASVGGIPLTLQELEALATLKSPLVNIKGTWVHVDAKDIAAIIKFIKQEGDIARPLHDLIRFSIGAESPIASSVPIDIHAESWLGELLDKLKNPQTFSEMDPAKSFAGNLRPYQKRGFSWMHFMSSWGLGLCLADDMGLGKTVQTLALIQKRKAEGEHSPVLLICPTSVVDNWKKEAEKFVPDLSVCIHQGSKRIKELTFAKEALKYDLVISSYSLLDRDKQTFLDVPWSGIILDEAQNIKNSEAKQAKAANEISCGYKIALTGTPVENHVGDLWSILSFLNPNLLGDRTNFRRVFMEPIQVARSTEAIEQLQQIVRPFILRRLKTDKQIIDDLPEKQEMNVYSSLTREQASLYKTVTKKLQEELKSGEPSGRSALVLSAMTRLKQICNHPALYLEDKFGLDGRSGKLSRLEAMLDEILSINEKALIFSQFAEMGGMIQRHLQEKRGIEVLFLHGGTPRRQRTEMVEKFQSPSGPSVFVLSLKAGGTGLNLTAANHVFHYDRWWNPAVENQATDRAFRIGQTKNVQVHKFMCAGTLEEKIDAMITSKLELAQDVISSGEGWLGKLTNQELNDVFSLSKEAFVE